MRRWFGLGFSPSAITRGFSKSVKSTSAEIKIGSLKSGSSFTFKKETYSAIPSLNSNLSARLERWSFISTVIPGTKNANSRMRRTKVSYLNSWVATKISGSGWNVIFVPVRLVFPMTLICWVTSPRENFIWWTSPSRLTSAVNLSERALTHFAPTPFNPPETW